MLLLPRIAAADDQPPAASSIVLAQTDALGTFLADAKGQTMYRFTRDAPDVSACSDACASAWPPVLIDGLPVAPPELIGEVGTIARADESSQLTYNHQPLYYYQGDGQPGATSGQGLGGAWFVVAPASPSGENGPAPPSPPPPGPAARPPVNPMPAPRGSYQDEKGNDYGY